MAFESEGKFVRLVTLTLADLGATIIAANPDFAGFTAVEATVIRDGSIVRVAFEKSEGTKPVTIG